MKIMKKMLLPLILGVGLACGEAHAMITTVYDHFDNGTLDPAWSVSFQNATGWSYNESGTNLSVADIYHSVINTDWAKVILSQTFTPLTDFNIEFNFSWESTASLLPMQGVRVNLYDSIGNIIASAGYSDAWVAHRGQKVAVAGGNSFLSGYDTLPFTGAASVDISRLGNDLNVLWDAASLVTGTSSSPLSRVDLEFQYYAYSGAGGTSFFGSESIDLVKIEGSTSPVPEPATMLLFGIGLVSLVGARLKRNKA